MAVRSGFEGLVMVGSVAVAHITGWSGDFVAQVPDWRSSHTLGFTGRVAGHRDATGTFDAKYDRGNVGDVETLFNEGDEVQLALWLTRDPNNYYFVTAIITDKGIEVDVDGGDTIAYSVGWGSNLQYFAPDDANKPVVNLATLPEPV